MVGELGHHVAWVYSAAVQAGLLLFLLLREAGVVDGAGALGGEGGGGGEAMLFCFARPRVRWGVCPEPAHDGRTQRIPEGEKVGDLDPPNPIFTYLFTCCKTVASPQARQRCTLDDGAGRAVAGLCVPSPATLLQILLRRKPPTAQIRSSVLSAPRKAGRAPIPDCPARTIRRRLLNLWRALVCMPSLPCFLFNLAASRFFCLAPD